jgi:phospholipid/cholesterol/gamma-HCH transport system permease protein
MINVLLKKITYPLILSALLYRILETFVLKMGKGHKVIRRIIIHQIYFTAVEILLLLGFIGIIFGVLVIIQGLAQLTKVGSSEALGQFLVVIIIRELGPMITAIVVILHSGTAIATEVGYMTVLGDIRAITMRGIDPIHFVAVPRFIGLIIGMVSLLIYFDVIALFGGFLVSWFVTGVPFYNFMMNMTSIIGGDDIIIGFIKAVSFSAIIVVVCIYRGFEVKGKITKLPVAISKSAIECFSFILIVDIMISAIFYL